MPFPHEPVEVAPVRRATEDSGCALAYPSGKGIAGGRAPPQPGEAAPIHGRRDKMPMPPGGWTMAMAWMRMPGQTWLGAAASFLGMWVVMMVAMMPNASTF